MNAARRQFLDWTDCLLDPDATPHAQREAAQAWCHWGLQLLGIDAANPGAGVFSTPTQLSTGTAIAPVRAAQCIWETRRTTVFLQAMAAALREARARFPHEPLHVVEAGCGPLAALTLPFAARHRPEEMSFTLVDLHPAALAGVRRIAQELGVERSIRACVAADVTTLRFAAEERPHVIACEVLLRALTKEPQVAATLNLAPQLRAEGIFLPERIDVRAGLMRYRDFQRWLAEPGVAPHPVEELGLAFSLDGRAAHLPRRADGRIAGRLVAVPPHDGVRQQLYFFTRIAVFRDHRLGDFDSSLNLPERVRLPAGFAAGGGTLAFSYEISAQPGLRPEIVGESAARSPARADGDA